VDEANFQQKKAERMRRGEEMTKEFGEARSWSDKGKDG